MKTQWKQRIMFSLASFAMLLTATTTSVKADELCVVFFDATLAEGDTISEAGDVLTAALRFDTATGDYTVTWTATEENPFVAGKRGLRFNLNLRNENTDDFIQLSEIFTNVQPTNSLSYSGTENELRGWLFGDSIVTHGTFFNSGIVSLNDNSSRDRLLDSQTLDNTAVNELESLMLLIASEFDEETANGLLAKLEDAHKALTDGNPNNDHVAVNKLMDFINQVEAQTGNSLTVEEADRLIEDALHILFLISVGC